MENLNVKRFKILKLFLFILVIILITFLTIKLFPMFKNLASEDGRLNFKSEIDNSGASGVFTIIGLQLLQILIPVLPGEPIEFLAGMCYGSIGGMIIIFIGCFLSSFIIFFCVRKFGMNFINTFLSDDKFDKIKNSKLFSNPNKIEVILFFLFLIPGTPKDLFVYLAGLLPIKPLRFICISTFARFPSIISSTLAGANVLTGNFKTTIFIYLVTFLVSCLGLVFYNNLTKKDQSLIFK